MTTQTVAASYGYSYDGAGNRTGEAVNTAFTKETPNALNQLVGRSSGSVLPIRGTTDEPVASVTVNGVPARLGTGGKSFAGTANVTAVDNNPVVVAATDFGLPPNVTTKNYQVAVAAGGNATLSYDDSGNLLSDGSRTYEWDAQDRLVAINIGTQRTEFGYDGLSRRVTITEKAGNTVTASKRFVMDGLIIAEERVNGDNTVNQRFYAAGVQVLTGVAPGRYLYTRDHLGSIREVWNFDAASLATRYDYDPYGQRTKLEGTEVSGDFGFTGHYTHAATNLLLATYRAYDPVLGRWLSRDPIEEDGGLNLYRYVANGPINGIDLLGLITTGDLNLDNDDVRNAINSTWDISKVIPYGDWRDKFMQKQSGWEHYFNRICTGGVPSVTKIVKAKDEYGDNYTDPAGTVAGFHTHWTNHAPEPGSPWEKDGDLARTRTRPEYVITENKVYRWNRDGTFDKTFDRKDLQPGDYGPGGAPPNTCVKK